MSLLEARGLRYDYPGGVEGLCGADLTVRQGRRLAILGANGSGKTTLLLHLNGTLRPSAGEVRLDGRVLGWSRSELNAWRRRVGLVLQEADDQLFAASVGEDVSFGVLNLGLPEAEVRARVAETLAGLRIPELADRPPHLLSFGQKKRVAIAGAVAMRPEILLLDEPTAGLDHHGVVHLLAVLDRLAAAGTTLVLTLHDVDLAYALADEVALVGHGRVLAQGPARAVLGDRAVMASARLPVPFVLDLGLALREAGLLAESTALPRRREELLGLLRRGGGAAPALPE